MNILLIELPILKVINGDVLCGSIINVGVRNRAYKK